MPGSSVGGEDCSECSEFIEFEPVTLTGCVGFLRGAVGPEIFAGVRRLDVEPDELLCVLENKRGVCSVSSSASPSASSSRGDKNSSSDGSAGSSSIGSSGPVGSRVASSVTTEKSLGGGASSSGVSSSGVSRFSLSEGTARDQEKGQSLALCSSDLQMLHRRGSGQSLARWPVCSQL